MIKCLAVDDEPLAVEQLKKYISKVPFLELVGGCMDAFEAMRIIADKHVDAIFIDINMPDLNGLDFVRTLIDPPLVVFTTAYSQYAIEGYKVDAIDYLLKPFSFDSFQRAANKVQKQYLLRNSSKEQNQSVNEESIYVKTDYKILKILLKDIIYIEGMSEYLKIYVDDKDKPVITLLSMKKIEEALASDTFMRIHKSYIINLTKIVEINKLRIVMSNDTYVPIGDSYKDRFFDYINNRFVSK